MNITKHYFDDKDETTDQNFNHTLDKLHSEYTSFSSNDRVLHNETLWNFRVKYSTEGKKFERIPIYENDKYNLEDETNDSGFTYEGVSYRPYTSSAQRGDIVGWRKRIFEGENGLTIAKKMKGVVKIANIRLEIPRVLFESLENFNNVLYISCDELSGFSNINVPGNEDVSFIAQLVDTSQKYLIFATFSEVKFITPINIKSLSFKVFNPIVELELNDAVNICSIQINSSGQLRIVSDNIPSSFEIGQHVVLPELTLDVNTTQVSPHYCSVIDGYIKNADVIFRNIEGRRVSVEKSDDHGRCILNFKETGILIATATDGIDISYGEQNQVDLKNIFIPGMKQIFITPITTIITDYLLHEDEELGPLQISRIVTHYEQKLQIQDSNSDYILNNNVQAGLISYQITTVIKVLYFYLSSVSKKHLINRSVLSLKLSLLMYSGFDFEKADDIHKLFEDVVAYYALDFTEVQKITLRNVSNIVALNNTFKGELDFDSFGDASKVVHNMMLMNVNAKYTTENIEELRLKYRRIRKGIVAKRNFIKFACDNSELNDDINSVAKMLNDILIDYTDKANVALCYTVVYIPFETDFVLGRLIEDTKTIEINARFKTTNFFSLNEKSCSPQLLFILRCVLTMLGVEANADLHHNDILQPRLSQSSYLTNTDVELLNDVGLVVDRNSSYIVKKDSIFEENTSSIEYTDNTVSFATQISPLSLDEIKTNIPISDKNGYCSLTSTDIVIENSKLSGVVIFGKSVFGTAKIKPMFFVDGVITKNLDVITAKVGHKSKSVHFSFDVDKNFLLRSETIRLDFLFHFGSFKKSQVIASTTYSIEKHLNWVKLNTNMKVSESLHLSVERTPVSHYKSLEISPIENFTTEESELEAELYQNLGLTEVNSSAELARLKYVNGVLYNSITKHFKVLTLTTLDTIQESDLEVLTSIEISNCVDFCYSIMFDRLFVVSSEQIHVLDDNDVVSTYSNSNFDSLKCIAGASQSIDEFIVVVGDQEFHLVDTTDELSLQKIGTLNSVSFAGSHRVCINNTDTKVFVISRTQNKLIQVDIKNRLLPVIEHELTYESMIEPRDLLYLHSKEHLCVACYSSRNILVFDVSDTSSPPTLMHIIDLLQNPCSISFDETQNIYVVGKDIFNISTIELYDTNGNMNDVVLPYEYPNDNDGDFIIVKDGIVTVLCSDIMKMTQYATTSFVEENRETQDISSLDLVLDTDGYQIKNINREVDGRHILDLDSNFGVKNLNLSIEDTSKRTLTNTDLQCNYTLEFTTRLSLE